MLLCPGPRLPTQEYGDSVAPDRSQTVLEIYISALPSALQLCEVTFHVSL